MLAEEYGKDLEGTDEHAGGNDWITYPEDHDRMKNLLARLLGQPSG